MHRPWLMVSMSVVMDLRFSKFYPNKRNKVIRKISNLLSALKTGRTYFLLPTKKIKKVHAARIFFINLPEDTLLVHIVIASKF